MIEKYSVNPPNVYGFGHQAYYEHVVDCLDNKTAQLVDGLQGRKSLELINAIYESIETGEEVKLDLRRSTLSWDIMSASEVLSAKIQDVIFGDRVKNCRTVQSIWLCLG